MLGRINIERKGNDIFSANALNQAHAINALPQSVEKGARVTAILYDSTKERGGEKIAILGADMLGTDFTSKLRTSAGKRMAESAREGKDLSVQTAHAIIVSDPLDLGRFTNPRIIFNAGQNEVFAVSAVAGKLGKEAVDSIKYALSHVDGVEENPHIVIMHTSMELAKEIEGTLIRRLGKGAAMTIMSYDRESGEARIS